MTFRKIRRSIPASPSFCATDPEGIRLSGHQVGQRWVMNIWLGKNVATKMGLVDDRYMVDLLVDNDVAPIRIAFCVHSDGEFHAGRRGRSHCIYLDAKTTAQLFPHHYWRYIIDQQAIQISSGMIQFDVPAPMDVI